MMKPLTPEDEQALEDFCDFSHDDVSLKIWKKVHNSSYLDLEIPLWLDAKDVQEGGSYELLYRAGMVKKNRKFTGSQGSRMGILSA
jgi:hypothetical protein